MRLNVVRLLRPKHRKLFVIRVAFIAALYLILLHVLPKVYHIMTEMSDPYHGLQPSGSILSRSGPNPLPPTVVPEDATVLTSENLPSDYHYMPEVGNGHIATVVQSDTIFMNGLYNGANITSHRARIPSTNGYSISSTVPSGLKRLYTLDMGRGLFSESYTGNGVNITLRTYVHRSFTRVLVTELVMSRDDLNTNVEATVHLNSGGPSQDVDFTKDIYVTLHGRTRQAEYPELAPQTDFYMYISPSLAGKVSMSTGKQTESFVALTVIGASRDVVLGEWSLAKMAFEDGDLLSLHVTEWNTLWSRGRIDVEGDLNVARINYACLYYTLSSLPVNENLPAWPFVGLSPGGLAHGAWGQDYGGHVFWDQDTWMFPSIALLYPDLGRLIVTTRARTLNAAKLLAKRTGVDGARYPWESAFTGLETCPADPYGELEIHINGDVPMMVRQYWQLTQDKELMSNGSGAEIVWETARFWASRAVYQKEDDTYRILGVMPPDEYHHPVNDSAYTNSIAQSTLRFANELKRVFDQPENKTWTTIADKMYMPYDPKLDYHPEFDGYAPPVTTKQADVVLMAYPLMVNMNESTRANDLKIYEKTTPIGPAPAMTWGIFLLGWLDLGNETKAAELFNRSILNVQQPFLVWSENSDGSGATNFLTGMGGYLQSVLFGYGGIRVYDDMMTFNPKLISGTTAIKFTGVHYRGGSLDLQYSSSTLNLTLTSIQSGSPGLEVKFKESSSWQKLDVGQSIAKSRQSFQIRSSQ